MGKAKKVKQALKSKSGAKKMPIPAIAAVGGAVLKSGIAKKAIGAVGSAVGGLLGKKQQQTGIRPKRRTSLIRKAKMLAMARINAKITKARLSPYKGL